MLRTDRALIRVRHAEILSFWGFAEFSEAGDPSPRDYCLLQIELTVTDETDYRGDATRRKNNSRPLRFTIGSRTRRS